MNVFFDAGEICSGPDHFSLVSATQKFSGVVRFSFCLNNKAKLDINVGVGGISFVQGQWRIRGTTQENVPYVIDYDAQQKTGKFSRGELAQSRVSS